MIKVHKYIQCFLSYKIGVTVQMQQIPRTNSLSQKYCCCNHKHAIDLLNNYINVCFLSFLRNEFATLTSYCQGNYNVKKSIYSTHPFPLKNYVTKPTIKCWSNHSHSLPSSGRNNNYFFTLPSSGTKITI